MPDAADAPTTAKLARGPARRIDRTPAARAVRTAGACQRVKLIKARADPAGARAPANLSAV